MKSQIGVEKAAISTIGPLDPPLKMTMFFIIYRYIYIYYINNYYLRGLSTMKTVEVGNFYK